MSGRIGVPSRLISTPLIRPNKCTKLVIQCSVCGIEKDRKSFSKKYTPRTNRGRGTCRECECARARESVRKAKEITGGCPSIKKHNRKLEFEKMSSIFKQFVINANKKEK